MGFDFIKKLPTPEEIRNQYPIDAEIQAVKDARDKELRDVFTGKSDKFLAIIGPCSADNEDAVLDYLTRLRNVQEKIADKVLIVPRVYTNKPRTTGEGYKGMVHQPDPEKQPNLLAGLVAIRKMHIHAIRTSGMTCADEMLYPENYRYLSDLLSYVAVGARSVEDQQHRLTVSGMEVPAGMKNPTSGDLSVMLNSVHAAQGHHTFIYRGWEVESTGNPLRTPSCAAIRPRTARRFPTTTTRILPVCTSGTPSPDWKTPPSSLIPTTPIPASTMRSRSGYPAMCSVPCARTPISGGSARD